MPLSLSLFRSRPVLVGLGCVALGLALLPLTLLYCYQRSLIYGPTRLSPLQYQAAVAALSGPVARIFAPFDALVFEPPAAVKIRGTAVFYHGNQGLGLERAEFLVPMFIARGLRLVIAEYPGYGARSGEPSEQSLVEDGNRLYAAVADRYRDEPLLLVGESLGSGVAVQIAARQSETGAGRRPARVVLLVPFLSLAETAARIYWYLPVRHFVQDVFDSGRHVARYAGTVAILAAGQDEIVGVEQARQLAELARARGETVYLELKDALHERSGIHLTETQLTQLLGMSTVLAKTP